MRGTVGRTTKIESRIKQLCCLGLGSEAVVPALLQELLAQRSPSTLLRASLSLYTSALLHSFNPEMVVGRGASALVEPLSQQEMRVLRLLVAGLSNRDIAQELIVSTNTVKTQVKSIYRKLNVSTRDEARQVARELRWS